MTTENPHAGKSAVVLDIGGDVGALIVTMPAEMDGLEVEIVPTGTRSAPEEGHSHDHQGHHHHPDGDHEHPHPPHVAVVARPTPDGTVVHSLVFGELTEGTYDLYVRPDGPVRLTATVRGGDVTESAWPTT